ncbi:MAG: PIG-L family deacetylase [Chloroflexi bacterium]|nr:PIG-L family deacetylase [Chloroflexota bacterium]
MRWIYISPHLDDAALSAGGLIHEQTRSGMDVEIWTMTCGFPTGELSPFARALHAAWGVSAAADLLSVRRAEDIKAAGILGAKTVHFDFLDCIYRRGKNGNWLYSDVFVPPHEDDADLPVQIAGAISARLLPTDQLVCQLGLGSHVDHVLVRRAVELLRRPLLYLADIPYLFNSPVELASHTAGMRSKTHRITESGFGSWLGAVSAYESQLGGLFDSPQDMDTKFQQYWSEYIGVRLWSAS